MSQGSIHFMLFTTCCWILFCRYWSWWSHSIQRAWLQPGFQNESENPRKGHHCGKCSFLWQWPLQGSHNGSDCWCRNCHGCQGGQIKGHLFQSFFVLFTHFTCKIFAQILPLVCVKALRKASTQNFDSEYFTGWCLLRLFLFCKGYSVSSCRHFLLGRLQFVQKSYRAKNLNINNKCCETLASYIKYLSRCTFWKMLHWPSFQPF